MRLLTAQTTENRTNMADAREKANERPIDGPFPELAEEVRRLLGYNPKGDRTFLTSRMASRKTGVNHATITTTVRGDRPSEGTILKLARGLGGDPIKILELAGYSPDKYFDSALAINNIKDDVTAIEPKDKFLKSKVKSYDDELDGVKSPATIDRFAEIANIAKQSAIEGDTLAATYTKAIDTTISRTMYLSSQYRKVVKDITNERINLETLRDSKRSELEAASDTDENYNELSNEVYRLQVQLADLNRQEIRLMRNERVCTSRGIKILMKLEIKILDWYNNKLALDSA